MIYSGNVFRKVYLVKDTATPLVASGTTTSSLTAGQLAIYPVAQNGLITNSSVTAAGQITPSDITIVGGSWHANDQLASWYGTLSQSIKSFPISASNVIRFWKRAAVTPVPQIVAIGWNTATASTTGPLFRKGRTYRLQVQLLGTPVLKTMTHTGYRDFESYTGCASTSCNSGCTAEYTDAASVMLDFSDQIKQHPWYSNFIAPKVYINNSGTRTQVYSDYDINTLGISGSVYTPNTSTPKNVVAAIVLEDIYAATVFTSSFTPTDGYELEMLKIQASLRMDDGSDADPCQIETTINTSTSTLFKDITATTGAAGAGSGSAAATCGSGIGESVIRDYIESLRRTLENFADGDSQDNPRFREVLQDVSSNVSRTARYDEYHLLYRHKIRPGQPSPVSTTEDIELVFYVKTGTTGATAMSTFTALVNAWLAAGNSSVSLETIS